MRLHNPSYTDSMASKALTRDKVEGKPAEASKASAARSQSNSDRNDEQKIERRDGNGTGGGGGGGEDMERDDAVAGGGNLDEGPSEQLAAGGVHLDAHHHRRRPLPLHPGDLFPSFHFFSLLPLNSWPRGVGFYM